MNIPTHIIHILYQEQMPWQPWGQGTFPSNTSPYCTCTTKDISTSTTNIEPRT